MGKSAEIIGTASIVFLLVAIFLPAASAGGELAVTYPPNNESLKVPTGAVKGVEIHLRNRGDEDLVAIFEPEGLDGLNVDYPENVVLGAGDYREVTIQLSSKELGPFSGGVHILFKPGGEVGGTGGAVVQSWFVPLEGEVKSEVYFGLRVTVEPEGSGSVTPSGGTYRWGEKVTLKAEPSSGHEFGWWSGQGVSGKNPQITVRMTSDVQANAHFVRAEGENRPENLPEENVVKFSAGLMEGGEFYASDSFTTDDTLVARVQSSDIEVWVDDPGKGKVYLANAGGDVHHVQLELSRLSGPGTYLLRTSEGDGLTFHVSEAEEGGPPIPILAFVSALIAVAAVGGAVTWRKKRGVEEEVQVSACPKCGTEVPEGVNYCPECGEELTEA